MMARASLSQLYSMEARYRELLLVALQRCASGEWGLFGQNDGALARMAPRERIRHLDGGVLELLELGDDIDARRHKLGISEPFDLHRRLKLARASCDANSPGEPKLAQQWLDGLLT